MENSSFEQEQNNVTTTVSLFDRITNSSLLKMFIIFVLTLLMLIPMTLVNDLVSERKNREQEVSSEIALKWGRDQVVTAPVLAVPYHYLLGSIKLDSKGKEVSETTVEEDWVFLLPNSNTIKTDIKPETLKRGIYNTVVYNADIELQGDFSGIKQSDLSIDLTSLKWEKAKLIFGIEDVKGLSTNPQVTFGGKNYPLNISNQTFKLFPNNMVADVPLANIEASKAAFTLKLELRGSKSINFLPLANQTNIEAKGTWNNPSFNGGYLPEERNVTEQVFEAKWGIPSFSRKLPMQWQGSNRRIYSFAGANLSSESEYASSAEVSVDYSSEVATDMDMVQINFLPEINNYQKINRVAKYGILIIVLTFASLFFTEIIKKQRIHMIQYILIGAAMVLFYSLLLAISEHLGFNVAYFIAAIATILLIASFVRMITKDSRTMFLFAGILALFYSFIFVLMQLRDYSLIVGTIGVFVILAVLMRVSAKINWFSFDRK